MHHILHIYPLGSPTLGKLIIPILQRVDWGTAKDTWIGPNSFQKPGTKSGFQRYHCNTTGISLLYLWCSEWQKRQSNASLLTKIKTNPTQYNTSNWTGTGTKKTVPVFFPPHCHVPIFKVLAAHRHASIPHAKSDTGNPKTELAAMRLQPTTLGNPGLFESRTPSWALPMMGLLRGREALHVLFKLT